VRLSDIPNPRLSTRSRLSSQSHLYIPDNRRCCWSLSSSHLFPCPTSHLPRLPQPSPFDSVHISLLFLITLSHLLPSKMLCKFVVVSALCAAVLSAPTVPSTAAGRPESQRIVNDYFNLLAGKVAAGKQLARPPVCDLSLAALPVACKHTHLVRIPDDESHLTYQQHQHPYLPPPRASH
jgi:hypothetical protein